MKKLALSLAVLFAVGLVSCGGNKDKEACDTTPVESTEAVLVEEVNDTTPAGDSATATTTEAAAAATTTEAPAADAPATEAPAETPAAETK